MRIATITHRLELAEKEFNRVKELRMKDEEESTKMEIEQNENTTTLNFSDETEEKSVYISTKCSECANQPICKYTNSLVEFYGSFNNIPEIAVVHVSCKYYKAPDKPYYKPKSGTAKAGSPCGIQIKHTKLNEEKITGDEI